MSDQVTFIIGLVNVFVFEYTFITDQYLWLVLALGFYDLQCYLRGVSMVRP